MYHINQLLEKASSYCAIQERCSEDVRKKLKEWGAVTNETENIIAELISTDFLNEERFSRSFSRGKFRINHWGRRKIIFELKGRKISPVCIKRGLEEISEEAYLETLSRLIDKKWEEVKDIHFANKQKKVTAYLIGKGFEPELILDIIRLKNQK